MLISLSIVLRAAFAFDSAFKFDPHDVHDCHIDTIYVCRAHLYCQQLYTTLRLYRLISSLVCILVYYITSCIIYIHGNATICEARMFTVRVVQPNKGC